MKTYPPLPHTILAKDMTWLDFAAIQIASGIAASDEITQAIFDRTEKLGNGTLESGIAGDAYCQAEALLQEKLRIEEQAREAKEDKT